MSDEAQVRCEQHGDQTPWAVCRHVDRGFSPTIWLRPDRVAVCEDCAGKTPSGGDNEGQIFLCEECLRTRVALVQQRSHDGVVGLENLPLSVSAALPR